MKLTDLLDEAVDRCLKELTQRRAEEQAENTSSSTKDIPFSTSVPLRKAAEAIGYSAIRYFDLKQNRTSNYRFSYDKMLDPKGETVVSTS